MRPLIVFIAALSLLLTNQQANAATQIVVDQDARVIPSGGGSFFALGIVQRPPGSNPPTVNSRLLQTFSARATGGLHGVEFQIIRIGAPPRNLNGKIRFTLFDGDYSFGARSVIGFKDVDFSQLPSRSAFALAKDLIFFDTSSFAYAIRAQQRYSIAFEVLPEPGTGLLGAFIGNFLGRFQRPDGSFESRTQGSGYTGGDLYFLAENGSLINNVNRQDIGFRSFVSLTGVPEPQSWAMFIIGFGLLGSRLRAKPRQFAFGRLA